MCVALELAAANTTVLLVFLKLHGFLVFDPVMFQLVGVFRQMRRTQVVGRMRSWRNDERTRCSSRACWIWKRLS